MYNLNQLNEHYNSYLATSGLFTWSGEPRSSGVGFFCFHALEDTKQKKLNTLDRCPPLHINRVLYTNLLIFDSSTSSVVFCECESRPNRKLAADFFAPKKCPIVDQQHYQFHPL